MLLQYILHLFSYFNDDVDITPSDPRWIGAWWLGFLVFGSFAVVFSIPLMCFPRRMRAKPPTELGNIKKTNPTERRRTTALLEEVKSKQLAWA